MAYNLWSRYSLNNEIKCSLFTFDCIVSLFRLSFCVKKAVLCGPSIIMFCAKNSITSNQLLFLRHAC